MSEKIPTAIELAFDEARRRKDKKETADREKTDEIRELLIKEQELQMRSKNIDVRNIRAPQYKKRHNMQADMNKLNKREAKSHEESLVVINSDLKDEKTPAELHERLHDLVTEAKGKLYGEEDKHIGAG